MYITLNMPSYRELSCQCVKILLHGLYDLSTIVSTVFLVQADGASLQMGSAECIKPKIWLHSSPTITNVWCFIKFCAPSLGDHWVWLAECRYTCICTLYERAHVLLEYKIATATIRGRQLFLSAHLEVQLQFESGDQRRHNRKHMIDHAYCFGP